MTLVVMADNGFCFLIAWELMSLVSYFLVVTEHEKANVRYAGFFYLVMTHIGTAFVVLTYLILFQSAGSFSFEAFRHPEQSLPEGMRALVFLAALIGFGTKAGIVPLCLVAPRHTRPAPSHIQPDVRRHDKTRSMPEQGVCDFLGGSSPGGGDCRTRHRSGLRVIGCDVCGRTLIKLSSRFTA